MCACYKNYLLSSILLELACIIYEYTSQYDDIVYKDRFNYVYMSEIKVWLDCDPGHDDMLAIIMAALNERIDLIGISTSAGNSVI